MYSIGSNMMVAIHGLAKIIAKGHKPRRVVFKLAEYVSDTNCFPFFFDVVEKPISQQEASNILAQLYPTCHGLSKDWAQFDKTLISNNMRALNALAYYFTPNWSVRDQMLRIYHNNNMKFDNATFIWARGTDKAKELLLPKTHEYLAMAIKAAPNHQIYIQTDDRTLAEQFSKMTNTIVLDELPTADEHGFHNNLYQISDKEFILRYKYTKIEYITRFLALLYLATQCKCFISYPGNLTTLVPILRGSFDNCFLFKNEHEVI
jgi:hypothetical protein